MKHIIMDFDPCYRKVYGDKPPGIYYLGNRTSIDVEKDAGLRSYEFVLLLVSKENYLDFLTKKQEIFSIAEPLVFSRTCCLSDFFENFCLAENKVKAEAVSEYQEAAERLQRKLGNNTPPVQWLQENYIEFLEFNSSACNWAPPFTINDRQGCGCNIRNKREQRVELDLNLFSYIDLPVKTVTRLKEERGDIYFVEQLSYREKSELLKSLPLDEQLEVLKEYGRRNTSDEALAAHLPFRLHLFGDDDCSYSKYFFTKEEAEAELEFLRKLQPLDFGKDILVRNYFFTN